MISYFCNNTVPIIVGEIVNFTNNQNKNVASGAVTTVIGNQFAVRLDKLALQISDVLTCSKPDYQFSIVVTLVRGLGVVVRPLRKL